MAAVFSWSVSRNHKYSEICLRQQYSREKEIPNNRGWEASSATIAWNWGLWKPTLTFCTANYYAALLSNHNMKWERKVHKIGLLRRFMRIAWTLNSSTRRYLRSLCPPWPVLHHHQPYDGTCSPQFSECQVGQNWSLCKYLTIFSSHGCGNLGQVGMDGCYNSVYFEEASIAVEFRC